MQLLLLKLFAFLLIFLFVVSRTTVVYTHPPHARFRPTVRSWFLVTGDLEAIGFQVMG